VNNPPYFDEQPQKLPQHVFIARDQRLEPLYPLLQRGDFLA